MLAHLILGAALAVAQVPDPATGVVWGVVRSQNTGSPLRYALVEIVSTSLQTPIQAETDRNGYYVLRDVPPGRRVIRASHIDHAPLEAAIVIRPGQQFYLDLDLELRPVLLPMVTARGTRSPPGASDTVSARATDIGTATVHVLEATPGMAELGLADAARDIPGQEPPDPSDVLFVRGGAADLKLVLLNGAPVYAPFHIGGLINALDDDLLRSATLYLGGAPARYDGGLSYVMDLETRSGRTRSAHAAMSVDMLAARTVLEGPLGPNLSFLAGGRAVHGLGTAPFVGDPFPYTYGDAISRIDLDLGRDRVVSVTGFWNRERVLLDSVGVIDNSAQWGNAAGSVRFRTELLGSEALFTVAAGEFETQLPLGGQTPILTAAVSQRTRAAVDMARTIGPMRLSFGGSVDRLSFEQRAWPRNDSRDSLLSRTHVAGDVGGVYVDADVLAGPRVRLRGGLRADVFSLSPAARLAPRLAVTVLVTERSALTLAAGRYRQYVPSSADEFPYVETTVPNKDADPPELRVARSSHLVLGLDQDLGDEMRLGIEGFYKSYEGLPTESGDEAEASGLDVWVRRGAGRLTGWFGYSLAWVWSSGQDPITADRIFAGRHLVSAGLTGPIIGSGRFEVRVAYGAGLPYTAIPEPETTTPVFGLVGTAPGAAMVTADPLPESPAEPDEPYLRLDAQLARTFAADLRGFAFELTPYIKVMNALDRRDALFYHLERNSTGAEPRALAALPVLPVVGLEWRF